MSPNVPLRYVLCNLHNTSARLRFLMHNCKSVMLPSPLPNLTDVQDHHQIEDVPIHPAMFLPDICNLLDIDPKDLHLEHGFTFWMETPEGDVPIFIIRQMLSEPGQAPEDYKWIELPDCFQLPALEREVLRKVYQHFMQT